MKLGGKRDCDCVDSWDKCEIRLSVKDCVDGQSEEEAEEAEEVDACGTAGGGPVGDGVAAEVAVLGTQFKPYMVRSGIS